MSASEANHVFKVVEGIFSNLSVIDEFYKSVKVVDVNIIDGVPQCFVGLDNPDDISSLQETVELDVDIEGMPSTVVFVPVPLVKEMN